MRKFHYVNETEGFRYVLYRNKNHNEYKDNIILEAQYHKKGIDNTIALFIEEINNNLVCKLVTLNLNKEFLFDELFVKDIFSVEFIRDLYDFMRYCVRKGGE